MTHPLPPMLSGGAPVLGHTLEFQSKQEGLFQRGLDECGPVFAIKLLSQPAAVLIGPEYQQIFFQETDKALNMHKMYAALGMAFDGLAFTASPEVYTAQRPILYLPFKGEKMAGYVRLMQGEIQQWLDSLGEQGTLELTAHLNTLVQNVAAHAFMGKAFRDQMGREFWEQFLFLAQSLDFILPPTWPLPKFVRRDKAKAKLRAMLKPWIDERRAHPDQYDDAMSAMVNARYADGSEVDDKTIVGMINGLMFAGHETTAGQAAWTVVRLLQNPEYLASLQRELAEKLPLGTDVDLQRLGSLHRVNWAVNEVTRLNPSAHILARMTETDLDVGTHLIPKGWPVFVTAAVAHRLPELFSEPLTYNPERFGPGREEDRQHRFGMIGFGGGLHKCAGMNFANNEMALITALLFQQFDLELLTLNPGIRRSMGANRPEPTHIRYQRKAPAA